MFWRFGFSATSTLDTLLEKANVTLEEVFDEEDLLQECKNQNSKLIDYLQQPRVLKRLLEHVVGTAVVGGVGGKDWEEKVRFKYPYIASEVLSCEIFAIVDAILSNPEELLQPFWDAVLTSNPTPAQAPIPHHSHPLLATPNEPASSSNSSNDASENNKLNSDQSSTDSKESKDSRSTCALENGPGRSVLAGYWAKVNGVFLDKKPREMLAFIRGLPRVVDRFVAHLETPAVVDLLYRIIQCEESVPAAGVIDWLSNRDLIPRLIELLSPSHSTDLHNTVSELLKATIALSAPSPATLNQSQGADGFYAGDAYMGQNLGGINNRLARELASEPNVRKMVSYMLDAAMPTQLHRRLSQAADQQLAELSLDGVKSDLDDAPRRKRLARPSNLLTLSESGSPLEENSDESAVDDDETEEPAPRPLNPRDTPASEASPSPSISGPDPRDSTSTLRPTNLSVFPPVKAPEVDVTPETCTSSLVTCIGIFIELIRKNNSDYFEQHLFHTLRTHLLARQQEIAEKRTSRKRSGAGRDVSTDSSATIGASGSAAEDGEDADGQEPEMSEEDEEMEGMEEAMAELADRLGIVHLGPLLRVLGERLNDFQELLMHPRSKETMTTSLGEIHPLTFERYRITELYAELLHCSNMALLNRAPGEGPQYSEDGTLLGGIDGLQILARTLQGGDSTEAGNGSTDDAETSTKEEDTSVATEKEEDGSKTMDLDSSTSEANISTEPTSTADAAAAEAEKTTSGEEATIKLEAPPTGKRSHSREASTRHGQSSSGGDESNSSSGGQEDTDDEALLNEISLGESNSTVITAEASATSVESSETSASSNSTPLEEVSHQKEDPVSSKVEAESGPTKENDPDDDARSIASAISGMSLAALTSPHPSGPPSPIDDSRELVVGDMLKKKFLDCNVIPSILGLFFDCPWNNFLHNVVYDILQQFFNGRMDVGLNRRLTLAVFNSGALTDKIMEGHQRNEESMAGPRRIRMGYMGHMNLIAEEVVKLLERYPFEIAASVADSITQPEWDEFVNESLRENREKESAPLAGGRPTMNRAMALSTADNDLGDDREVGGDNNTFASYLSSQIGAGGSDDDDSDEDTSWLSQVDNVVSRNEFDDAFEPPKDPSSSLSSGGDDDDWGPFADTGGTESTFDWPGTSGSGASNATSSTGTSNMFSQNLTPADWAAEFRREGTPEPVGSDADSASDAGTDEGQSKTPTSGTPTKESDSPFVDLLDPASYSSAGQDVVATAHARRPSLTQTEDLGPTITGLRRRASSSSGSSDPSAAQAISGDEPLGPGISAEDTTATPEGLVRRMSDGTEVRVPLDEIALTSGAEASETKNESAVED